ncbi:MerR family transcriptional regulator [Anoxybacillus sediminis]|nr:MerR family transcriptional regulator [Anoxybacillus sediminis]NNV03335.1 MerR family transcriptional regulator [Brevibacillus sp. MCWH]UFJ61833.1 MerR family transcriptional regulator [Anoxybacillus sediminis]
MPYMVKEVAELAGVSVRTLHYYDQIGLLKPAAITPAGYRLYTDEDLERLQQILFFKELGFPLQEIKQILDSPGFDRAQALRDHKQLLLEKKKRLEEIIRTVDKTLSSIEGGITMDKKDMFGGFDMTKIKEHQEKYAAEARAKYGSAIVDETERRTNAYTESDWARIMGEWENVIRGIVEAMENGPADPQVQEGVGKLRQHITRYYYECTPEIFRGLGELYVADERFTATFDKYREGLAAFLREAVQLYCDRLQTN